MALFQRCQNVENIRLWQHTASVSPRSHLDTQTDYCCWICGLGWHFTCAFPIPDFVMAPATNSLFFSSVSQWATPSLGDSDADSSPSALSNTVLQGKPSIIIVGVVVLTAVIQEFNISLSQFSFQWFLNMPIRTSTSLTMHRQESLYTFLLREVPVWCYPPFLILKLSPYKDKIFPACAAIFKYLFD